MCRLQGSQLAERGRQRELLTDAARLLISINTDSLSVSSATCAQGASAFRRRIWQLHASQQGASHPSSLAAMVALAQALAVKGDHGGAADLLRRASRGLDAGV